MRPARQSATRRLEVSGGACATAPRLVTRRRSPDAESTPLLSHGEQPLARVVRVRHGAVVGHTREHRPRVAEIAGLGDVVGGVIEEPEQYLCTVGEAFAS